MNFQNCFVGLANWSKSKFPNIRAEIRRVNTELEHLQQVQYTKSVKEEELKLKTDLENLLDSK